MDYFERKLDEKNRLTIPAEIRREFEGGQVVITPGFGESLHMYPEGLWKGELEQALRGEGWSERTRPVALDEEIREINLKLRRGLSKQEMDAKQGRVVLENHLLKHAGIQTTVSATRVPTGTGSYWVIERPKA
jgi:MraZ protein